MKTGPGHQKSIRQIYTFSTWNINTTGEYFVFIDSKISGHNPLQGGSVRSPLFSLPAKGGEIDQHYPVPGQDPYRFREVYR
jgi:hypothetical protein